MLRQFQGDGKWHQKIKSISNVLTIWQSDVSVCLRITSYTLFHSIAQLKDPIVVINLTEALTNSNNLAQH